MDNLLNKIFYNLKIPHKIPKKILNKLNYYFNYKKYNQNFFEKEQNEIFKYFGLNRQEKPMTFSEVASMTGLSTMGAQKVVMRGIGKLKKTPIPEMNSAVEKAAQMLGLENL